MRVFVAIEISSNNVINSIKKFQKEVCIDAKAIEPRNLHFTLQFLGEISENMLQKIKQALSTIEFSSFNVNLIGIGAFPKPKSPRVVWIGTDTVGGNLLIELSQKVNKMLEPLGLISDKTFKPHITVFRIKKKVKDMTKELESRGKTEFGTQKISTIKLKKSELTPNGPIYSDLMEISSIS